MLYAFLRKHGIKCNQPRILGVIVIQEYVIYLIIEPLKNKKSEQRKTHKVDKICTKTIICDIILGLVYFT